MAPQPAVPSQSPRSASSSTHGNHHSHPPHPRPLPKVVLLATAAMLVLSPMLASTTTAQPNPAYSDNEAMRLLSAPAPGAAALYHAKTAYRRSLNSNFNNLTNLGIDYHGIVRHAGDNDLFAGVDEDEETSTWIHSEEGPNVVPGTAPGAPGAIPGAAPGAGPAPTPVAPVVPVAPAPALGAAPGAAPAVAPSVAPTNGTAPAPGAGAPPAGGGGGTGGGNGKYRSGPRSKFRLNAAIYPRKDAIPDVTSSQVKAWVAEIDWSKVPNIPVASGLPDAPHFPRCPGEADLDRSACWWSCSGCTAPDDVVTCPSERAWGLTYDDGPSLESRNLVKYLGENKLTATFFIVGSRVLEYPDILKEQVAKGHHIAMHTWSHAGLTTLTNHEIVAEIRWTEKVIRDVTGLTMKYVRPPYGDTDNRVREILRQMGYTTVIWTKGWDTNDWRMLQHQVQESDVIQNFHTAVGNSQMVRSPGGRPAGPITLEHDLNVDTIKLSKRLIPIGMNRGLQPMSLAHCLADQTPYQRGSKLGLNGATEKPKPDDNKDSYMGIPGMSESDFSSAVGRKASQESEGNGSSSAGVGPSNDLGLVQTLQRVAVALTAVATVMWAL
ncbi:chitin deacetylase [Lunasporangiospora selenospora]|uniref:Chitin deacetylase n=1 Tax=Lunasporangiospora selenospora TaxID=979761 RepID=A0A9P6KCE3_9FUNG|nr:chitin deacetylase [Lunasporangiospora selenospora]